MMDSVVYVSGPMTGYEDHNKPAFAEAAAFLRAQGYTVLSPPELNTDDNFSPEEVPYSFYLQRDIESMLLHGCNTICLLRGWNASKGARAELQIAWALDWPVWYYDELDRRVLDMGRIA